MKYVVFYFVYNGWKERPYDFYFAETEADAQELILALAQTDQYEAYLEALHNEEIPMDEILDEVGYLGDYAEYYDYQEANCYGC